MEFNTKILIADENHNQRMALREGLIRAGYRYIEEAVNGEDALIKLGRFHPDIALIDIWLSKMDGIGVIRNSRNIDYSPDKPPSFIVVSMVSNQGLSSRPPTPAPNAACSSPLTSTICDHIKYLCAAFNCRLRPSRQPTINRSI